MMEDPGEKDIFGNNDKRGGETNQRDVFNDLLIQDVVISSPQSKEFQFIELNNGKQLNTQKNKALAFYLGVGPRPMVVMRRNELRPRKATTAKPHFRGS